MCKLARLGCTQYPIWSALSLSLMLAITASAEDSNSLTYYSTSQFSVTEFDRKMYLRNAPPEAGGGYRLTRKKSECSLRSIRDQISCRRGAESGSAQ